MGAVMAPCDTLHGASDAVEGKEAGRHDAKVDLVEDGEEVFELTVDDRAPEMVVPVRPPPRDPLPPDKA
ncbi:hypothetical protein Sjap_025827 [Stephania japonica]|uniref:Uncharacterized protein n=1 Tax=Stephania japonica TaxID=461633 RepID=A0AAP0E2H7_9MAGN